MEEERHLEIVLSTVAYLRNFFGDDAFEELSVDEIGMKVVRREGDASAFYSQIQELVALRCRIAKVVLGLFQNGKLVERYDIRPDDICSYRELCIFLQELEDGPRAQVLCIKAYLKRETDAEWAAGRGEKWKMDRKKVSESDGIKVSVPVEDEIKEPVKMRMLEQSYIKSNIRCLCNLNSIYGDLVECSSCKSLSHAQCLGFISARDPRVPKFFQCGRCLNQPAESTLLPTCRRVIGLLFSGQKSLKPLGIPSPLVKEIKKKLAEDGLVRREGPANQLIVKNINKDVIKKIKIYFNIEILECWSGNKEIKMTF